jgi:glutamate-1-semialdehyde 2,1-aminomutase
VTGPNVEALGPRETPNALPWTKGLPVGITDEAFVLPWNDLALVERLFAEHGSEIAAVITEPVMCNNGCIPPEPGFLEGLRALTTKYGSLLIFDEVITGFRTGLGGAQAWFGVTPDLAVFGKAMASGYPISVLCGKREYMQLIANGTVIHAGTMNSGNPTVAAALATLDVLEKEQVPARLKTLGLRLMAGLRDVSQSVGHPLLVQGLGPMFHTGFHAAPKVTDLRGVLGYDRAKYAAFVGGMQDRGIRLIGRGLWYISAAHTEADIDIAIKTAGEVLGTLPPV